MIIQKVLLPMQFVEANKFPFAFYRTTLRLFAASIVFWGIVQQVAAKDHLLSVTDISIFCDVSNPNLDCDGDGTKNGEDDDPLNPCIDWTIQLPDNDCDGDGISIAQGDTNDQDICIPKPTEDCEIEIEEVEFEEEVELEDESPYTEHILAIINNPCPTEVENMGDCDGDGTPNNLDEDPFNPCIDWTNELATNDCDGDGITVGEGDTNDQEAEKELGFDLEEESNENEPVLGGIQATIKNPCPTEVENMGDCDGDGTPNNVDEDPFNPCIDWTNELGTNDCDGDGITVGEGDTNDQEFEEEVAGEDVASHITINNPCQSEESNPIDCDGDGTVNDEDEDPLNPCIGWTNLLGTNDCDGDGITIKDGDPDDFDYCNPIEGTDCSSNSAIPDISQINLVEPCPDSTDCHILVNLKALLQGAYDEDNPSVMYDKLRSQGLIPLQEPYSGMDIYDGDPIPFKIVGKGKETTTKEVLKTTGTDAIVDWIFIELHDALEPKKVVATRSALLQRDGDIVDVDGVSPLRFEEKPGAYYIAVRHRNHLGVMTKTPINLTKTIVAPIDFTNISTPNYQLEDSRKGSKYAQRRIDDIHYLWGGNSNADWATIYQGPGLDQTKVFYDIFINDKNKGPDGFPNYNFILRGYSISDSNMDGEVRYQGPNNDIDDLQFFNIILHPDNPGFFSNKIIYEQIPSNRLDGQ